MNIILIIISIFLVLIVLFLFYRIIKIESFIRILAEREDKSKEAFGRMESIENLITEIHKTLSGNLSSLIEISRDMRQRSENIAKFFEIMQKSSGVKGGFGEYIMEDIIKKVLPSGTYEIQKTGFEGRPDCIIKIGERIVPLDSKFPLTAYKKFLEEGKNGEREFKRKILEHLQRVSKYIRPEQNTYNFALMFIPSEAIYSTILSFDDLVDEAMRLRVFPVSPSTFYIYLSALALGFRGLEVERNASRILKNLQGLNEQVMKVLKEYGTVENHVKNAWQKLPVLKMEIEKLFRIIREFQNFK